MTVSELNVSVQMEKLGTDFLAHVLPVIVL